MANTLTGLYPILYNAMNIVSREMIGFVSAVSRDATAEQAALDQTVRSPVVGALAVSDITPSNVSSTGPDQAIQYVDLVIDKHRKVAVHLTGEEERGLGSSAAVIARDRFAQAFRALSNEVESDLAAEYIYASRAYGTPGTTPFNTGDDLTDASEVMRILDDNGAPRSDRHLVTNSAAVAKLLGKQPAMFRVNEAGDAMARRFGALSDLFGFEFHHSGGFSQHTAGTASSYVVDTASTYAVGDTTVHLDTGTGTHVAGDVVTFAGDDSKYVVTTGDAGDGDKDIVLGAPGLRETLADGVAATSLASYLPSVAMSRDAIQLAARVPAIPSQGDNADDRTYITDPVSGLVYEVSLYRQYRQVSMEIALCWGVKTIKPEHMALLLG